MRGPESLFRVLEVDLSKRSFAISSRPDLFEEGLGGAGVAIRLLEEHCPPGADPLGPENPIVFAVGPLVGLFPLASKTVAMFKSPHTGNLGESHAGGRSAVALRLAGFGALVIKGVSTTPVYLVVQGEQVKFRDASALWGLRSSYTAGSVIRQREEGSGLRTIMRIGRAGERLVTYASVITETYRHFGRLGLGAVFGSKKLKALVIWGNRALAVNDQKAYRSVYDTVFQRAIDSPLMQKYHQLGTAGNVIPLNGIQALPTRNLTSATFEGAELISGERLAREFLGRRVACAHCPVACIHLAALRTPYPHDPYFYKTTWVGYDHEPIYAVGSMLGVSDVPGMLALLDEVETQGLDVMTTGVVLAWATEAFQRGLIPEAMLDGVRLSWGDAASYQEAVKRLVSQPTDLYSAMARGVRVAAQQFGGEEFALQFGGNEMPGYHTGPACHVGYFTGARHSHLDSAGYSLDQKLMGSGKPLTPLLVAEELLKEERWRQVLTSLVICLFARGIYTEEVVREALEVAGFPGHDLARLGVETLRRKHAFKRREGFDPEASPIPARIFQTEAPAGRFDEAFFREAVRHYMERL